ncbi:hypothetical protein [Myxosarcina sp. GI1(2024)]
MGSIIELHRKYDLEVKMCSAFWYDTPRDKPDGMASLRRSRLKLERELILRFFPPFNKETWRRWGQPFGKI